MPAFFRSIRWRLALTYSVVVFGLAFVVIAGVNLAISGTLDDEQVANRTEFLTIVGPDGSLIFIEDRYRTHMANLEQLVNTKAQDNLRRFSLWALLGMFPASIGLGWLIADRSLQPIGEISDVAKEIQAGDLSRRIALEGPQDELRDLAETFDAMLDRVEEGVTAQRDFIQDTSHELRNPLAIMRTNLEVALADPEADVESLRSSSEVVLRTLDRTSRTVDDLIAFARHDVRVGVFEPVELGELAAELAQEYQTTAGEKGVAIVLRPGDGLVDADRGNVRQAVANLMRNAVAVAPTDSTVTVTVGSRGEWSFVKVSDQGPGIALDDQQQVFERNWSKTVGGKEGGAGLGLAIARQIAEAHRGTVTLAAGPGPGAEFVLWLPTGAGARTDDIAPDGIHHEP